MPSLKQKSKLTVAAFSFVAALLIVALYPAAAAAEPSEPVEPPQLAIEPGSYDFGLQPLNWGSRETWFQLRNVGGEQLQVGSPQIVGPGSEAFWANGSPCYGSYLQPGESCSVQVYFGPHDAVEYTAQFRVNVGEYWFSADLSGIGGRATLAPSSNPTDFGVVKVGSAGAVREITISNIGNMPGGVFIAVIAGGAIGSYQILDENCTGVELVPAATCTIQVRFQPVSEGVKKAMLGLFGDNDGPTPIVLTGVGTTPDPVSGAGANGAGPVAESASPKAHKHRQGRRRHRRHHLRAAVHGARLVVRHGDGTRQGR